MAKAYIYLRVSHKDSAESGLGIAAQEEQCRRYFDLLKTKPEHQDMELAGAFMDKAVSAYQEKTRAFMDRPQGSVIWESAHPGDHIIFARLDRAFRNVLEHARMVQLCESRGIHLHFVDFNIDTSTPQGRLMMNVSAAFAQAESDFRSAATKAGLAMRQQRPKRPGMKHEERDGKTADVSDRQAQAVIRLIRYLKDVRGMSYDRLFLTLERAWGRRKDRPTLGRQKIWRLYWAARELWPERYPQEPPGAPRRTV